MQTGNRRKIAFGQAENVPYPIFFSRLSQLIAAALALHTVDIIVFGKDRQNPFQIFERYSLTVGNVLHRNIAVTAVFGQINHHTKCISSSC